MSNVPQPLRITRAEAKAALSRLSAKAKLGEAEIREAKREVLENLRKEWAAYPGYAVKWVICEIDEKLAALEKKGEKDGKD